LSAPVCTIIAGPNGAGKTTFALRYLPLLANCSNFINADLIAAGLSPLYPERELLTASKLFLSELKSYIGQRRDFAFETTLSGRAHIRLVQNLLSVGWRVQLFYLWLPSIDACINRVAERVATGGHDIPPDVIARRYARGTANLLEEFAPRCTATVCMDNSGRFPVVIFTQYGAHRAIHDAERYSQMLKDATHE